MTVLPPAASRNASSILVILATTLSVLAGCTLPQPPQPGDGTQPPDGTVDGTPTLLFDAGLAFEELRRQVVRETGAGPEFYYRVPGTEGNEHAANLIAAKLVFLGFDVAWDNFTVTYAGDDTKMHNIVGRLGTSSTTLYIAAHYDTRPWADNDPDPASRDEPVLGANDGASGVAALLELARVFSNRTFNFTLVLLFFDGEDGGTDGNGWILGSTHYAGAMTAGDVRESVGFILLDMVADKNLVLMRESSSANGLGRALQDLIWREADLQNATAFNDATGAAVLDDHRPFLDRGMKAVDVIHLDNAGRSVFPDSHHTTFDDLDHVSAESLGMVGRVIEAVVYRLDGGAKV